MTETASSGSRQRRARVIPPSGPAEPRRVTLQDVARHAGVSFAAVSKVIRGAYGVSPEMRAKVTAAIETLGYRPDAAARAMRGRSFTIGVMLIDLASPFQPEVINAISDELEPTTWQEILIAAGSDPRRQQRSIEALVDRQVDGLILIAPWISTEALERLGATLPTVAIARHCDADNFDTVVDDDHAGAGLVVDHLVGLGHRRIAHTSHPSGGLHRPHVLSHTARCDGYLAAMEKHGLVPDVIETSYSEPGGYEAGLQAFRRSDPPTAIFAGADIAALGVLRAAEELGIRVPEDVSVAGYDNVYAATIGRISLTTVDQSGQLTGSTAARLLLERINGRTEPVQHVISPRLVVRSTTAQVSWTSSDQAARSTGVRRSRSHRLAVK